MAAKSVKNTKSNQYRAGRGHINSSPTRLSKGSFLIKWMAVPAIMLVVVVGYFVLQLSNAASPQGTYTNWTWSPPSNGYNSLQHSLTIEEANMSSPRFWAHQYQFIGGDGGYMGLQTIGNRADGTTGKSVVFSIFSSGIAATPGACKVQQSGFDGYNTSGSSCIVAYDWQVGRTYTLRTAKLGVEGDGAWWGGWVKDNTTGVDSFIAQIKTPPNWQGIGSWSSMWTEYYGPTISVCSQLPYSRARFSTPIANGGVTPGGRSNFLSTGADCSNSAITISGPDTLQAMGSVAPPTPDPTPNPTPNPTPPPTPTPEPKPPEVVLGVIGRRITPSSPDAVCHDLVVKGTGSPACKIGGKYPTFLLRYLPSAPAAATNFCFLQGKSAKLNVSYQVSIGTNVGPFDSTVKRTTTPNKVFEDICIPIPADARGSNVHASVQVLSGASPLIYAGYFK